MIGRPGTGKALSPMERKVLALLHKGLQNDDISAQLGISSSTVKVHLKNSMGKIGAYNRIQLVMKTWDEFQGPQEAELVSLLPQAKGG